MSVLIDPDFLLHTLQLSYLRHVLPNHAALSNNAPGGGGGGGPSAYSLIAFPPPADLAAANPYLALSGTTDPHRWPELATTAAHAHEGQHQSGRSSPPLAPLLTREAGASRRGGAGAGAAVGGLQYSQTIGKGVVSAGMKVDGGRPRTWKGRGKLGRAEDADEGQLSSPPPPSGLAPPPVVVHSPTKTPRSTPAIRSAAAAPSNASAANLAGRSRRRSRRSLSSSLSTDGLGPESPASPGDFPPWPLADAAATGGTPSSRGLCDTTGGSATPLPRRQRRVSDAASSSSGSGADSDFPDGPAAQAAPPKPKEDIPAFQLPPGLRVRERRRVHIRPGEVLAPAANSPPPPRARASSSSSVDSDFGVRVPRSAAVPPAPPQAPQPAQEQKQPEAPAFQLPPGLRVRERRRVNIRPGQAVAPMPAPPAAPAESRSSSPDSDFADRVPAPARARKGLEAEQVPPFELPPGLRVRERRRVHVPPGGVLSSLALPGPAPAPVPVPAPPTQVNASSSLASDFGGGLPSPVTPATPASLAPSELPPVPPPQQQPPAFQLPPGLKVRERRRVNIRPGAAVLPLSPVVNPANDAAAATAEPAPTPAPAPPAEPAPFAAPALRALPSRRRSSRPASPSHSSTAPYFPPRSTYLSLSHPAPAPSGQQQPPPAPRAPVRSALSALLAASDASGGASSGAANPFSALYALCVAREVAGPAGAGDGVPLRLFFPSLAQGAGGGGEPVEVRVKKDVTVEEVIGVGLWRYWDEGREPPLVLGGGGGGAARGEDDAREGRETARWALRIVEDGEVDEDFPPLERTRAISAFAFTEFAIVPAEDEQIEDNLAKQATIVRRPSRILASAAPLPAAGATAAAPAGPGGMPSLAPQTCPAASALAVPVQLKVVLPPLTPAEGLVASLADGEDAGGQTSLQVPSDMYLADVLDILLRRRGIRSPARDWALVVRLQDGDLVVPLDRTVGSLGEQRELELVPRAQVGPGGVRKTASANQDPSQSIFAPSRLAGDGQQPASQSTTAAAAASAAPYLHYNVLRKLPMSLGGRHARVIAIDGDYLHFMPPETNLPAPTRGRTTSFHVSAIHSCKVSRRSATSFKIVVHTKRGVDKRYDFEAESAERASEIVAVVRRVMEFYRAERRGR